MELRIKTAVRVIAFLITGFSFQPILLHAAHITQAQIDSNLLAPGEPELGNGDYYYGGAYVVSENSTIRLKLSLTNHWTESGYQVSVLSSNTEVIDNITLSSGSNAGSHSFTVDLTVGDVEEPTPVKLEFNSGFIVPGYNNPYMTISVVPIPPTPTNLIPTLGGVNYPTETTATNSSPAGTLFTGTFSFSVESSTFSQSNLNFEKCLAELDSTECVNSSSNNIAPIPTSSIGTLMKWRIRSCSEKYITHCSDWSAWESFLVVPLFTALIEPPSEYEHFNPNSRDILFSWEATAGANAGYQLYICKPESFDCLDPFIDQISVNENRNILSQRVDHDVFSIVTIPKWFGNSIAWNVRACAYFFEPIGRQCGRSSATRFISIVDKPNVRDFPLINENILNPG